MSLSIAQMARRFKLFNNPKTNNLEHPVNRGSSTENRSSASFFQGVEIDTAPPEESASIKEEIRNTPLKKFRDSETSALDSSRLRPEIVSPSTRVEKSGTTASSMSFEDIVGDGVERIENYNDKIAFERKYLLWNKHEKMTRLICQVKDTLKKEFHITVSDDHELGSGEFGSVYEATGANGKQYVLKVEKKVVPLLKEETGDYEKWWRDSDFAASRRNLRNMIKPLLIVIQVNTNQGTCFYSLPPEKAKDFGQKLYRISPEAKVGVVAQLMERAPGEDLEKILKRDGGFKSDSVTFRDLLNGCFCYMEDAHYSNLLHLDIKPANIMFARRNYLENAKVNIIDGGIAKRGARPYLNENEKEPKLTSKEEGVGLTNPRSFSSMRGTPRYMHPSRFNNYLEKLSTNYESHVNHYSFGLILLESLDPITFDSAHKVVRIGPPETYLERYLEILGAAHKESANNSNTVQALNENPEIKELLKLTFQYSGTGSKENFQAWQKAFHTFQAAHRYTERTDFSKNS